MSVCGGRALLASLCLTTALGGCTKVNEQPPVPPAEPAPPQPRVHRGTRPAGSAWSTSTPSAAPVPVAAVGARPASTDADLQRANTLNGHPAGPSRVQMQKAIDGAMPGFQTCLREATGTVNVILAFTATPSGRVEAVSASGGGTTIDRCLSRGIEQLKLPVFEGDPVPISFPMAVERTVSQPAPRPPASPPPSKPPSVFVKP